MLAYKVVEKKTRYSSNAALWLRKWSWSNFGQNFGSVLHYGEHGEVPPDRLYHYDKLELLLDKYHVRNYILKYDIGAELYAIPNSPGIMCFQTYDDAMDFIQSTYMYYTIIIEVEGEDIIHHDTAIELIAQSGDISKLNNKHDESEYKFIYYHGMISFNKVTVLT